MSFAGRQSYAGILVAASCDCRVDLTGEFGAGRKLELPDDHLSMVVFEESG